MFAEINLLVLEGDAAGLGGEGRRAQLEGRAARESPGVEGHTGVEEPAAANGGRREPAPAAPAPLVHSRDA